MICRAHLDGGGDLPEHVVGELVVERHHQDLLERLGRDLARVAAVDRVEQVLQAGACSISTLITNRNETNDDFTAFGLQNTLYRLHVIDAHELTTY